MAVTDRDYMKAEEQEKAPTFFTKLNEFGERHAKLIIFLSTVVIIVTVLIVADSMWRKARFERGLAELDAAASAEEVQALREKYADDEVLMPRILYRLANTYQQDATAAESMTRSVELLKKAEEVYNEFRAKYANDVLAMEVEKALHALYQNLEFIEQEQEAIFKSASLMTHPLREAEEKDSPIKFGPANEANPVIVIDFGENRLVEIELYEDAASNTVANFIELVGAKYFDGLSFHKDGDKRVVIAKKETDPVTHRIAREDSQIDAEAGSVAMLKNDAAADNLGAEFTILTTEDEEFKDHTVFGQVLPGGIGYLKTLKDEDKIVTITIKSKRDHEYKAVKIEP